MIELCDDIDKDLWIYDTIPLDFDLFSIDDEILKYMEAHSKFPKSNEKRKSSHVLIQYGYFG